MASIRESGSGKRLRFIVTYRNDVTGVNASARRRTLDEAMQFYWLAEISEHQMIPLVSSAEMVKRWSVQKAVWFWLGYQYNRVENRDLSLESYSQYKRHLAVIPDEIMCAAVSKLTPRRLGELPVIAQKYLRFVFGALVSRHWLTVNPVGRLPGRTRKRIELPEKKMIVAMLRAAGEREKMAILLGAVCGLRPGELVALRYCDVSREKIHICRHLTPQGEREGTKRGPGREVDMPDEVWSLLDKGLLNTQRPLITGRDGQRLSLNYSKQGVMRELLKQFGVGRYYDLRHFAITNLLRRGVTIADAAAFAGHTDPSLTAKFYTHLMNKLPSLTGSLEGD